MKKLIIDNLAKESFNIGFFFIMFIFFNVLTTSLFFLLKISITNWNFILATFLSIGLLIHREFRRNESIKNNIIRSLIVLFIIVALSLTSIIISTKLHDTSWDGNTYHKTAIGAMKNGWNPVYENIETFDKNSKSGMNIDEYNYLWSNHYAKTTWIFSANMYKITENIESGKSITLFIGMSTFFLFASLFFSKKKYIIGIIVSLLISFNPVYIAQLFTYYLDGLVGNLLFLLILCIYLWYSEKEPDEEPTFIALFIAILVLLINLKFNAFAYAGLTCLIFFIYFITKIKEKKLFIQKYVIAGITAVLIGILLVGASSYVKNTIQKKHPFYPLMGAGSVDIMTAQQVKSFEEMPYLKKFFVANFYETNNQVYASGDIKLNFKMPFTYKEKELKTLQATDSRIGGYGVYFGGILILSLIILPISIILKKKKSQNTTFLLCSIASIPIIILFLKDAWWARYFPQLYLIPIAAIITSWFNGKKLLKFASIVLIYLLCLNNYIYIKSRLTKVYEDKIAIVEQYEKFYNNSHNKSEVIITDLKEFSGTKYNILDFINKYSLDNLKISFREIEDTDKYDAYQVERYCGLVYLPKTIEGEER